MALYMIFDENQSWFLEETFKNIQADPAGTKKDELIPVDAEGHWNLTEPTGFAGVNL